MALSKREDLRLKVGNLMLAVVFSIVPTAMTIAFLSVHGLVLCRDLSQRLDENQRSPVKQLCQKSNFDSNLNYVIWIWLFTMLPTWRWFYVGHYKRLSNTKLNKDQYS